DLVERSESGKTYPLTLQREGKEVQAEVKLEQMPGDYTAALRRVRSRDQASREKVPENEEVSKLGVELSPLNPEMAEQLGVDSSVKGLVVRKVNSGSPADEAGLQPGDIIQRVGTRTVTTLEDFRDALDNADPTKGLLLHIRRG